MKKNIYSKVFSIIIVLMAHAFYAAAQPAAPTVTPYVVACGSTTFNISATPPDPSQQVKWYSDYYMQNLLYTGNTYSGTATQSQTFYASTFDPGTGLQSSFPATAYVFVPKPPVAHPVAGVDPITTCLGAINVTIDTTYDSVTTVDIADTYVMLNTPGTNYGTLNYMTIWSGIFHPADSARLYLKFDLSQIPPNAVIQDARLSMTSVDGWAHGNNGGVYAHFVTDDSWTEAGITWDNKPACTPFNIGWSGGTMGLPTITHDTVNDLWTDYYSSLPNTLPWYDDGNFDFGNMTDFNVVTRFSRPNPFGSIGTYHGLYPFAVSEYAGDKILSMVLESPGYDTRWRTKEYTSDATTIPFLRVYFGYNSVNSTFAWTGPNGFTSTQQNLTGLQQGTYTLVVTNPYGCSDTTQVNVTNAVVTDPPYNDTTCTGVPYIFYGHQYTTSGVYSDTLTSSLGCDSIVSVNLYIKPPIQAAEYDTICIGGSYVFNGNIYTTAGAFTNDFTTPAGCDSIVTVNVFIRPADAAPQVVSPIYYCQDSITVPLSINGTAPIYWYDASQGGTPLAAAPVPVTTTPGNFYWYVSDTGPEGCETQRAEITVHVYPTTDTPVVVSPTYCKYADAMQLQANGSDLLWYTQLQGGTSSSIAPTPSTLVPGFEYYYVTQTVNGCQSPRATLGVQVYPPPPPPVPLISVYCQNEIPQNLLINGDNLLWYTADSGGTGSSTFPAFTSQLTVKTPFYVSQTVNGCESDRAVVYVEPCCTLELPSAFTPNNDGKNDLFRILTNGKYLVQRFSIYDRWGAEIYSGTGNNAAWDGTIKGTPAAIGDYYYYILYTCGASGELSQKGDVTLVR